VQEKTTIISVSKAFRILEFVKDSKSGCCLTDLVKNLRLSMGAVQRITNTLLSLGYLYREPQSKIFHLTPKFLSFASACIAQEGMREIILPHMRKLNEELDEIVNLAIMLNDEEIVYIARIDNISHILTTNLQVGTRRPIQLNSIGKVILAFLPGDEQKRILEGILFNKYPSRNIITRSGLQEQIQEIRQQGYSANRSELFPDLYALAAPILNHQGMAVAGINVVIPMSRFSQSDLTARYIPCLLETARTVSQALGNVNASIPLEQNAQGGNKDD
jgi:IclR family transcriptional regulator, pca regulon regulatory protein